MVRLIGALAPAFADGEVDLTDTSALTKRLNKIDFAQAPEALAILMEMVEKQGGPDLVTRVWDRTVRLEPIPEAKGQPQIGDKPVKQNIRYELKDPSVQDHIFGDANFGEYWMAFVMVLLVNFTRYGRTGSPSWKAGLEKLTGGLWSQSENETERPRPASSPGSGQQTS